MNTTDQAFIRAYGSDFVPSNADEAARAADYPALARSNVNAVFGALPQRNYRVDAPTPTSSAAAAQPADSTAPSPMVARPYVPQPAPPRPSTAVTSDHVAQRQPVQTSPAAVESDYDVSIQQEKAQDATPVMRRQALPQADQPAATHPRIPRPHLNFASVKPVQPQVPQVEPQMEFIEPQPVAIEPTAEPVEAERVEPEAEIKQVESTVKHDVELPSDPAVASPPATLRPDDGLAMWADSAVVIGSSAFEWPSLEPAIATAPTMAADRKAVDPMPPTSTATTSPAPSEATSAAPVEATSDEVSSTRQSAVDTVDAADATEQLTETKSPVEELPTDHVPADEADAEATATAAVQTASDTKVSEHGVAPQEASAIKPSGDAEVPTSPASADASAEPANAAGESEPAAEPAATPVSKGMDSRQQLKPAWEVDRLMWPADADRLYDSEAEYFRHAGEKLRDASQEGLRVLGVSSSHGGEGCTTLAICLARSAAAAGAKVALVDANLLSPQLGAALGLDFAHSWHETLDGETPLAEAAVTAIADNVTLLPLSKHAVRQGLSLDSDAVNKVLRQASESFDLVLIDVGSLGDERQSSFRSGADCPLDAAIVVRDVRTTSEEETLDAVSRFRALGIEAVGVAENFAAAAVAHAAA